MKKIILEKREHGYYRLFGQRFAQYDKFGSTFVNEEFNKLKNGDRIEIKKMGKVKND